MSKIKVILGPKASSFYDPTQEEGSQKILKGQIVEVKQTGYVSELLRFEGLLLANPENLAKMGIPNPDTEEGQAEIKKAKENITVEEGPATVSSESLEKIAVHNASKEASEKAIEATNLSLELENKKQETLNKQLQLLEAQTKADIAAANLAKAGSGKKEKEEVAPSKPAEEKPAGGSGEATSS